MLVIQPIGGPDDWRALFHEGGHTEHFAHTSRDLSMEEKRLGDNAVTEGWAMLLQHLTDEPAWLTRRLDFPRPAEYAVEGATGFLYFVRRYAAKILYEIEFHAAEDVTTMRGRYAELLSDALKIDVTPANYLADIDSGFYVSVLPALLGVRGAAAGVPEGEVRHELVRLTRGRLAAARALERGPEHARRGDAEGGHGLHSRDGGGRRAGSARFSSSPVSWLDA